MRLSGSGWFDKLSTLKMYLWLKPLHSFLENFTTINIKNIFKNIFCKITKKTKKNEFKQKNSFNNQ